MISGVAVRVDGDGRYCLNDLHKAAGGEDRHKPVHFLALDSTQDMVNLLKVENPTFKPTAITKGKYGGSFSVKELVYKYANWISTPFYLNVKRPFSEIFFTAKVTLIIFLEPECLAQGWCIPFDFR
jgi:hypothetical protein